MFVRMFSGYVPRVCGHPVGGVHLWKSCLNSPLVMGGMYSIR